MNGCIDSPSVVGFSDIKRPKRLCTDDLFPGNPMFIVYDEAIRSLLDEVADGAVRVSGAWCWWFDPCGEFH